MRPCLITTRKLAAGLARSLFGCVLLAWGWISVCSEPIISEFLASNATGYRDDDGERSDWIELHNPDSTDINLAGWFLTDDRQNLQKWVFPSTPLVANQYGLVFASGKDRSQLGAPLHTNFRLRSEGEYLALVNPQTEVVFEFAPQYPKQFPDVSYGEQANSETAPSNGFMFSPSPRMPNHAAVRSVLEAPVFSVSSRPFVGNLEVRLAKPNSAPENSVIQYTLDGKFPDKDSPLYVRPLILDQTTQLRVRLFGTDGSASPVVGESYIQLHRETAGFTSDLPLIVLENFQGGRPPQNAFQPGFMAVMEKGANGRSALSETPQISTRVGLKVRGSSTAGRPKPHPSP